LCGKYGHKSHLCRHKPPQEESEPAKKASDGGKIKQKFKKKKGKKEKAKRVAELIKSLTLHTPVNSSEEETSSSDSDNSPSSLAVMRMQEHQTPLSRREARANEFASLISDQKEKDTLNRTHLTSKVKRAKIAKGMSHTEGKISHSEDTTLAILCGCLYFLAYYL